jgi:hypothetical protein
MDTHMGGHVPASEVRSKISHPIIDADGHFVELAPVLDDELLAYIEETGGKELKERYLAGAIKPFDTSTVLAGRNDPRVREHWQAMPSWWGWQTKNTRDRATSHLPKLLYNRLDEFGIDFMLTYPSLVLSLLDLDDGEMGGALARATNKWLASIFRPYEDRMAVGGIIPMTTPQIAIQTLEHAVKELGLKTMVISGYAKRPLGEKPARGPQAYRLDHYGLDSDYDYDPFWARCIELGVAPVTHSAHQYHRVSRSVSSYVYNHIGGLATSHESLCKSLFLGGVTHRFPKLRVGFLEGGVSWACGLYSDLLGHWKKRNKDEIQQLDPDLLNVDELMGFVSEYGDDKVQKALDRVRSYFSRPAGRPEQLDEFEKVVIRKAEDLRDKFIPNFYFGCEADDPLVKWAFAEDVNPMGARLRAMIGSDISHWDVQDMREPIEEAYEMLEDGKITERDFEEFAYLNPVRLHAALNPDFFKGTTIERQVAQTLAKGLD